MCASLVVEIVTLYRLEALTVIRSLMLALLLSVAARRRDTVSYTRPQQIPRHRGPKTYRMLKFVVGSF
jgi:hypothetical protein